MNRSSVDPDTKDPSSSNDQGEGKDPSEQGLHEEAEDAPVDDEAAPTDDPAANSSPSNKNASPPIEANESSENNAAIQLEEKTSYSTRGTRAQEELAAVGDLLALASPDPRPTRESFLSDSLTEEERRTRTRFLPDVDGMQSLSRSEAKSDLTMARASAEQQRNKRNRSRPQSRENSNDSDEELLDAALEDDAALHVTHVHRHSLALPAVHAFVPPATSDDDVHPSPRRVEAIVAFNPPRPTESVGAVRAHRLARWERRPDDIDTDLNKCRKTVQKTREELANVELELQTVTAVDNCLRRHFLHQVTCLNEEMAHVGDALSAAQAECLQVCQLPQLQRARTRGAFKAGSILKDVLQALRAKGPPPAPVDSRMDVDGESSSKTLPGDGGMRAASLSDWDRSIVDEQEPTTEPASTWVSGKTADGGTVVALEPGIPVGDASLPPRAKVSYPYGEGYFAMDGLKVQTMDPAYMTDEQLVQRWEGLLSRGVALGGTVDISSAAREAKQPSPENNTENAANDNEAMETDENEKGESAATKAEPLVPFGSGLIPTAAGRGDLLYKMPHAELNKQIRDLLSKGKGVIGTNDNMGVPSTIRSLEEKRRQQLTLRAKTLHLRNQLVRQKRTRINNEKTFTAMQERAGRVESLVAEMRTDLKSLKRRLDKEMRKLGISEEHAESILTSFYMSLDSQHQGEASPPKKARRASRMVGDDELEDAIPPPEGETMAADAQQ